MRRREPGDDPARQEGVGGVPAGAAAAGGGGGQEEAAKGNLWAHMFQVTSI